MSLHSLEFRDLCVRDKVVDETLPNCSVGGSREPGKDNFFSGNPQVHG